MQGMKRHTLRDRLPQVPAILAVLFLPGWLTAQFTEISSSFDINNIATSTYDGCGLSWYDFNQDGHDDLTLGSGNGNVRFFLNDGAGELLEVLLGITNTDNKQVKMVLWADYDNDGDSDLLITHHLAPIRLWRQNDNLTFTEVAAASGIPNGIFAHFGAAWCDYDHDGDLDLYIAKFYNPDSFPLIQFRSDFYRNNGNGTFTEVTETIGLDLPPRPCFQPVFFDYDHDGWEDLYLIIDRALWANELFKNNGDGTFTNVTAGSGLGVMIEAMTGTVDDYDNDADFDVYITNGIEGNKLFRNDGEFFTEIAQSAGVTVNAVCWGSLWLDYDNDSWQDLFVGTTIGAWGPTQNRWFINNQNSTFSDGNAATGIVGDIAPTFVTAMGDLNNDGYYDYANSNNDPFQSDIWLNDGGTNNYLSVSVEGVLSNKDGIGTWIDCYAGGNHYVRFTLCGENFIAQNSEKEIFGLGSAGVVDSLVIHWPLGIVETYYDVSANQHLHLIEGESFLLPFAIAYSGDPEICPGDSLLLTAPDAVSYLWNTGAVTQSIYASTPGSYSVALVNDQGYPQNSLPFELMWLPEVAVNTTVSMVACHGAADGSISLSVWPGQVAAITWNTADSATVLSNLPAGTYSFEGTNTLGCAFSGAVTLTEPDALSLAASGVNATCHGASDGSITAAVTGGTPGYTLTAEDGPLNELPAGVYTVEVTDSNGCIDSAYVLIEQPASFAIWCTEQSVSCFGFSDGAIVVDSISGGTPGYSFSGDILDSGSLTAGPHAFTVTDAAGCDTLFQFFIAEPAALEITLTLTEDIENGSSGTANLDATGGTPPYSVLWSTGANDSFFLDSLYSGWYSFAVTDASGCSVSEDFFIPFVVSAPEIQPGHSLIYPNPATTTLYVGADPEKNIQITGILASDGRLLPDEALIRLTGESYNISDIPPGTYWLLLSGSDGCRLSVPLVVLPR